LIACALSSAATALNAQQDCAGVREGGAEMGGGTPQKPWSLTATTASLLRQSTTAGLAAWVLKRVPEGLAG
jgi:hypothetical protein